MLLDHFAGAGVSKGSFDDVMYTAQTRFDALARASGVTPDELRR